MHADTHRAADVSGQIVAFKRQLAPRRAELKRAFEEVRDHVARAAREFAATMRPAGRRCRSSTTPTSAKERFPTATRDAIRTSGVAVVRGVFPRRRRREWFDEVGAISKTTPTRRRKSRSAASTNISRR